MGRTYHPERSLDRLDRTPAPYREGVHTLSMDLYATIGAHCGIDLPVGFQIEFGRQISGACRDRRLPFRRKTVTRGSIAAWEGLDETDLVFLMGAGGV